MTCDELLALLAECDSWGDPEGGHREADKALLAYIDDPEVTAAFEELDKWYA